jgi:hypothetical protein
MELRLGSNGNSYSGGAERVAEASDVSDQRPRFVLVAIELESF